MVIYDGGGKKRGGLGVRWLQTKGKRKDAGNNREFKKQTEGFERRTSTGSGLFGIFGSGFANIFGQVVSIRGQRQYEWRIWKSSKFKRVKASLQVDVHDSKTPLLNLLIAGAAEDELRIRSASLSQLSNRLLDVYNLKGKKMKKILLFFIFTKGF